MREKAMKELIERRLKEKDRESEKEKERLLGIYHQELESGKKSGKNEVVAEEDAKKVLLDAIKEVKPKNRYVFVFIASLLLFVGAVGEFLITKYWMMDAKIFSYYISALFALSIILFIICICVNRSKHGGSYLSCILMMFALLASFVQILPMLINVFNPTCTYTFTYTFPYAINIAKTVLKDGKEVVTNRIAVLPEMILTCYFSVYYLIRMIVRGVKQRNL